MFILPQKYTRCSVALTQPRSRVCTLAAALTPPELCAPLSLRQKKHHFYFGQMAWHVAAIWHNASRAGQKVGCKEKIKQTSDSSLKYKAIPLFMTRHILFERIV